MRKFILGALLASAPAALAGGYAPAPTPTPTSVPVAAPLVVNVVGVPALPLSTAATTQPSSPAPAAAARAFLLTAPSGTSVTLKQTTSMQVELEDMQVTGSAAEEMSAADIEEMKASFAEMSQMPLPSSDVTLSVGEVFADGSRELVTTTVTEMPAESGMEDLTMSIIQTVGADGKIRATRVETDNAELQQMFDGMSEEMLSSMNSGQNTDVYGFPLVSGHTVSTTETVEMQALMSGLMMGMLQSVSGVPEGESAEMQQMFQSLKAEPLTVTSTTTYRGLNAAGQHLFTSTGTAQPWKLNFEGELPEGPGELLMDITMNDMQLLSNAAYRADGLPAKLDLTQDMRVKMDMTTTGAESGSMSMTMRIKTATTMQAE